MRLKKGTWEAVPKDDSMEWESMRKALEQYQKKLKINNQKPQSFYRTISANRSPVNFIEYKESPTFLKNGLLFEYQVQGLK